MIQMTNEQAITSIQGLKYCLRTCLPKDKAEAIDMAIEALQRGLENINTDSCSESPNRSDLISRQDAIDIIDADKMKLEITPSLGSTAERDFKIYNQSCNKHIELIKQLLSAQSEIIRCENCYYFVKRTEIKAELDGFCADWGRDTCKNWYCSRAERKKR